MWGSLHADAQNVTNRPSGRHAGSPPAGRLGFRRAGRRGSHRDDGIWRVVSCAAVRDVQPHPDGQAEQGHEGGEELEEEHCQILDAINPATA